MITSLRQLLFSSTSKDSGYLFFGMIISNFINFVLIIILTNNLNSYSLGLFLTALTFAQLIIDLSDLGINSSLITFISAENENTKLRYLKTSFVLKMVIGLVVSFMLFISSSLIAGQFFNKDIAPLFKISSFLIFAMIIINWSQAYFQSQKKFLKAAVINTTPNVLRLIVLITFLGFYNINEVNAFSAFSFVLIISLLQVAYLLKVNFLKVKTNIKDYLKITKFGLPIGLSFAVAAIFSRFDQLLIFKIKGGEEAGIYGLALRVSLFFVLAATALNLALAPRFATIEKTKFANYFSKSLIASILLAITAIVSAVIAPIFWDLIFPKNNMLSVGIYQVLALGTACFILSAPFYSAILYKFKKNKFGFISSIFSLVLVFILLQNLIPVMGAKGAAIAISTIYLLQLVIASAFFYFLKIREYDS